LHLVLQRVDGEEQLFTIGSAVLHLAPLLSKPASGDAVRELALPLDTGAGGPACELRVVVRVGDRAAAAGWLAPPQSPSASREAARRAASDLTETSSGVVLSASPDSPSSLSRRFNFFRRRGAQCPDALLL
jgi:hypothetical protein